MIYTLIIVKEVTNVERVNDNYALIQRQKEEEISFYRKQLLFFWIERGRSPRPDEHEYALVKIYEKLTQDI